MTYWVIAQMDGSVYMAADCRVSTENNNGSVSFCDGYTKLVATSYQTSPTNTVHVGMCFSGLVSDSRFNAFEMQDSLNAYMKFLEKENKDVKNYIDVIKLFYFFLKKSMDDAKVDELFKEVNLGVAVVKNDAFSIGGWNGEKKCDAFEKIYLEASFDDTYLASATQNIYQKNQGNFKQALQQFVSMDHAYETEKAPGVELTTSVIFSARHNVEGHPSESNRTIIGYETDVLSMNQNGVKWHQRSKKLPTNTAMHTAFNQNNDRLSVQELRAEKQSNSNNAVSNSSKLLPGYSSSSSTKNKDIQGETTQQNSTDQSRGKKRKDPSGCSMM